MELLLAALMMGVIGSPHCIGMCGGFAAACARPRGSIWLWHGGRLTSYAVLGAAGGLAGGAIPGPRWLAPALSVALLVWFAASLAQLVPQRALAGWRAPPRGGRPQLPQQGSAGPKVALPGLVRAAAALARREGPAGRYLFGIATGLLPCGMVYAALAMAFAASSPLLGAGAMVAFGLGNVPALTLLSAGVQRFAARGVWQRRALATLVLAAGVWSIARRPEGMLLPAPGDAPPAAHSSSHQH